LPGQEQSVLTCEAFDHFSAGNTLASV
jgi:hypothetical protein